MTTEAALDPWQGPGPSHRAPGLRGTRFENPCDKTHTLLCLACEALCPLVPPCPPSLRSPGYTSLSPKPPLIPAATVFSPPKRSLSPCPLPLGPITPNQLFHFHPFFQTRLLPQPLSALLLLPAVRRRQLALLRTPGALHFFKGPERLPPFSRLFMYLSGLPIRRQIP